jgi:hypothetical protein
VRFQPSRLSYAGLDPAVLSSMISAVGSLATTATQTIGGIEMAKVTQAGEERAAQAALETERLATERALAAERTARRPARGTSQGGQTSVVPYVAGAVGVLALVAGGLYWYRSRRT